MANSNFWQVRDAAAQRQRAKAYFSRHGLDLVAKDGLMASLPVDPQLGLIVVIPALAEPDLLTTLDALQSCELPECGVEIVVVINAADNATEKVRSANAALYERCVARTAQSIPEHVVLCNNLPPRHAGVGLARKLGLDAALGRLLETATGQGLLVNLDADCLVAPNYLTAIEAHFQRHPENVGASIYFEHCLDNAADIEAIAGYELHLRYFVHALRYAGLPHVFHTVGSCMAVRSDAYMAQGGMNRRQAGEDYYFVQKLAETGAYSDLTDTTVYPSSRQSWRVPFGTGRAMASYDGGQWPTYALDVFDELAQWVQRIPAFRVGDAEQLMAKLPDTIQEFLAQQQWSERLREIQDNTASGAAFEARVHRWFNNFLAMKFIHYATKVSWPKVPVHLAAGQLMARLDGSEDQLTTLLLLTRYRQRCADQ